MGKYQTGRYETGHNDSKLNRSQYPHTLEQHVTIDLKHETMRGPRIKHNLATGLILLLAEILDTNCKCDRCEGLRDLGLLLVNERIEY